MDGLPDFDLICLLYMLILSLPQRFKKYKPCVQAGGPQSGLVLHETAQIWPEEKPEVQRERYFVSKTHQSEHQYIISTNSY